MKKKSLGLAMMLVLGGTLAACNNSDEDDTSAANEDSTEVKDDQASTSQEAVIGDGSSTVFPILEIINEDYNAEYGSAAEIGVSGTGAGFDRFISGETDFQNASRPIKDEEKEKLDEAGIDYTELEVAVDGLTVAVNKDNDFVEDLTFEELYKIYSGEATNWSDVRSDFPDEKIAVYGPDQSHGTHDFFKEEVMNDEDITGELIQDTNQVVNAVTSDKNAIGFFGYNFYLNNKDSLKALAIQGEDGSEAVEPTEENVKNYNYPLSRALYVYVADEKVKENDDLKQFIEFTLDNATTAAEDSGYVALDGDKLKEQKDKFNEISEN